MSWRTIIVQHADKVSLFLDSLVVTKSEISSKYLISDLNCVLFEDFRTVLTSKLINRLVQDGVLVVICNDNHEPGAIIQPINAHHQQLRIIQEQLNWTIERKRLLWTQIVKQKIENQIDILKINQCQQEKIEKLYRYSDEIELADVTNREGHAAKVYFKELFGNKFSRSDESSIINSGLNYGYSIIRTAFCRTISSKGLHPSISLFHSNRYDCFALADDLMEPFRPIVDQYVLSNHQNWTYFGSEEKIGLVNILNSQVFMDNKYTFLTIAINQYVDKIMDYMNGSSLKNIVFPYVDSLQYYEL